MPQNSKSVSETSLHVPMLHKKQLQVPNFICVPNLLCAMQKMSDESSSQRQAV